MGIFTRPQSPYYVPPLIRGDGSPAPAAPSTFLGRTPPAQNDWLSRLAPPPPFGERGYDPNVVPAADPGPAADETAQQVLRAPQGSNSLAGRDPSTFYLKFNGRFLSLHHGDEIVAQWPGVSGRENFGTGKDQEKADYGPIPEGTYDIKQSRYQHIDAKGAIYGLVPPKLRKTGEWPGSVMGWGAERVWADPTKETVQSGLTFGRKDMAIHGGWTPGSAGCIDLTSKMGSFAETFRSLGHDLKLYVDYGKSPP